MDKKLLNGFEEEEKKGKDRIELSIDWYLKIELKKLDINVSELVNQFLWYYIKKKERDNKQADKEKDQ